MIFLGFLVGPAVAFFVADSVVTAHDGDEELYQEVKTGRWSTIVATLDGNLETDAACAAINDE